VKQGGHVVNLLQKSTVENRLRRIHLFHRISDSSNRDFDGSGVNKPRKHYPEPSGDRRGGYFRVFGRDLWDSSLF